MTPPPDPDSREEGGAADPRLLCIDLEELDRDPRDDEGFVRIDAIDSSDSFTIMAAFVDQLGDRRLAQALTWALQQHKPFRRFKDELARHPAQREAWFQFERTALERIARRWCEGFGITPRWTTRRQSPSG